MLSEETPVRVSQETIVGHGGSFVWFCIPKNASRTLKRMLQPHGRLLAELITDGNPRSPLLAMPRPPVTFAFVRNPYTRIVSVWRNKVFDPPETPGQERFFACWPDLKRGMPLEAFIEWLGEQDLSAGPDPHWRPQHHYLMGTHARLCVDFVGRLEFFDRHVAELTARLGLSLDRRHDNASRGGEGESIDDRSAEIIARSYRRDFEMLGYDADTPPAQMRPLARLSRPSPGQLALEADAGLVDSAD